MTTKTLLALAGTLAMIPAAAQAQSTYQQQRDRQPERQQDRDESARERLNVDQWFDEYFGSPREGTSDMAKLRDLAGMYRIQVTRFAPLHGDDAGQQGNMRDRQNQDRMRDQDRNTQDRTREQGRQNEQDRNNTAAGGQSTSTGIAERRFALDGTVLVERYTLEGTSPSDLPLCSLDDMRRGAGQSGMTGLDRDRNRGTQDREWGDNDRNDPNIAERDRNNPDRNAQENNERDRLNQDRMRQDRAQREGRDQTQDAWAKSAKMGHGGQGKQGIVLWGYNQDENQFNVVWTDSAHGAIRSDSGKLGADNELTLEGEYTGPDGKEYNTKTVIKMDSANRQTVTMYRDGGMFDRETKVLEIVYTKMDDLNQAFTRATTD